MTPLVETSNATVGGAQLPAGCWRSRGRDGYTPCDRDPVSEVGLCADHLAELQEADR